MSCIVRTHNDYLCSPARIMVVYLLVRCAFKILAFVDLCGSNSHALECHYLECLAPIGLAEQVYVVKGRQYSALAGRYLYVGDYVNQENMWSCAC